jgi:hypothetical protein
MAPKPGIKQVIDSETWDRRGRASWFAGMGEQPAVLIAGGATADDLTTFEEMANEWLVNQGVPDPPFRIIDNLPSHTRH